jgi:signal transduction histidine kinase
MRRHGFDLLIVLAAAAAAAEAIISADEIGTPAWFAAPVLALIVLSLLARRIAPFAAPAGLWLCAAGVSFIDGELIPLAVSVNGAGMAAAFLLGRRDDAVQARIGLVIVAGSAAVVMANYPASGPGDVVLLPAVFALAWLAGYALRQRAVQVEAAEAAARVAVAEERARIARELHDVVAHAMSVMVLQVGAVRHRLPADAADAAALRSVEETGRSALGEMRLLLGALRREDDESRAPQPGLEGLDRLLEQVRAAGLPVELRVEGEPVALPGALDLSAYRIVQEGLTNALKHAHARAAEVRLRYTPGELAIDIRDDGVGGRPNGAGHGLVGIRERVRIYGGEMSAAPADGGGFLLSTTLPLT